MQQMGRMNRMEDIDCHLAQVSNVAHPSNVACFFLFVTCLHVQVPWNMVLNQEEIEKCREAFERFDKDGSGTIDAWELKETLKVPTLYA
jgi:hypothetical protein